MSTKGTIAGRVLLGSSAEAWTYREGTSPTIMTVDVMPGDADALLKGRAQPVQLVLGPETTDRIYVIGEVAGPNRHIRTLQIADRRYWWTYTLVKRRFNVRRRVGYKQPLGDDLPDELKPIPDDIAYAPWSTKDGDGKQPWLAKEALDDVFELVLERERELNGQPKNFRIEKTGFGRLQDLELEDVELDTNGAEAIGELLRNIPQSAVKVEPNGEVVVYSKVSGEEVPIIQTSGPESMGQGHVIFAKHHKIRPSSIRVYFTREFDLRFDFEERAPGQTASQEDKDDRFLDNVLPVPDFKLNLAKQPGREEDSRTVAQGTWIPLVDALDAWNRSGGIPNWGKLDLPYIRRAMVPFWDLWAAPRLSAESDADADWLARMNAIEQHYRQTYRINRRWMDRIYSLRSYRVGIIDSETGTRAPATAYSNYSRIGTARSFASGKHKHVQNIQGYPPAGVLGPEARPAPARVSVVDSDQGIVRLDYLADVLRMYNVTLPSYVLNSETVNPGPTSRLRDADLDPVAFDAISEARPGNYPQLSSSHQAIVILAALAGAPNDKRQLHMIEVTPGEIENLLPPLVRAGLTETFGPPMDVRVGPTPQTTAMVKWDDRYADRIEQAFGLTGTPDEPVDLTDITLNAGDDTAPLNAVARALAASIYASFSDRYQGSKTVRIRQGIRLAGWIGEVTHVINTDGEASTRLTLREGGPTIDLMTLVPKSIRLLLNANVQPGGAG